MRLNLLALTVCLAACNAEHVKDASLNYNAGGADTDVTAVRAVPTVKPPTSPEAMSETCRRAIDCYRVMREQLCQSGDADCNESLKGPESTSGQTTCANFIQDAEARGKKHVAEGRTFERPADCQI